MFVKALLFFINGNLRDINIINGFQASSRVPSMFHHFPTDFGGLNTQWRFSRATVGSPGPLVAAAACRFWQVSLQCQRQRRCGRGFPKRRGVAGESGDFKGDLITIKIHMCIYIYTYIYRIIWDFLGE